MWVLMEDGSYRNLAVNDTLGVIETSPGVWQVTISAGSTASVFIISGISEGSQADAQTALAAFVAPYGIATP